MKKHIPKIVGAGINILSWFAPNQAAKIALKLFCSPQKGHIKEHELGYLAQFEKKMVNSPEGRVATFRKNGTGKKVLFCHGWESNSYRWRKVTAYLDKYAPDLDIMMMDAPGHGGTESSVFTAVHYKEMINAVNSAYKADMIVGHSVGAFSVALYLQDFDHQAKRAILLAPPDELDLVTKNYFKMMGYTHRIRKYYDQVVKDKFPHDIYYYNASDFAKNFEIPGVVIHDKADSINYYFEGEAVASEWKEGELISIEGTDHSLQREDVYQLILEQIRKI